MISPEFISWFQIPQNFINISTIVILAWTAIETARARRSSNDAHEYNLLPLLTIYFEGEFNKGVKLYIKNFGEGVAYNVQVKPWKVYFGELKRVKLEMRTKVKGINAIAKGKKAELHVIGYNDGVPDNSGVGVQDFLKFMITPYIHEPTSGSSINLRIEFKNAY